MKIRLVFLSLLLIFSISLFSAYAEDAVQSSFSKTQENLQIEDVLTQFKASNPHIQILEGKLEVKRAEHRQAKLLPNPELGYRVEDTADKDTFIEVAWPVDLSGRRWLKRKAAKAGVASAESLYAWEMNSLLADVKSHFFELLANQEQLRALEEGARRYEAILNDIRGRSGQTDYDRLRLEKEAAEVKADASEAKRKLIQLKTDFSILLNENPNNLRLGGDLKPKGLDLTQSILEDAAISQHPKVVSSLKQAESKLLAKRAARRKWLPELHLSGGFKSTSGGETDQDGYVAGVSVALPLFDRGQAEYQSAQGEQKITEAEAVIVKNEIKQRLVRSYQDVTLLTNEVRDYETVLLHAERLEQMAGLSYLEGRLKILELLDAYRGAIDSRLRYFDLALELKLSEIELERIMGRSLDSLTEENK